MLTPELRLKRLGCIGASEAAIVMGGLSTDGLATLVQEKAGERVFGDLGEEGYKSKWMQRGELVEEEAISWAEFYLDTPLLRQQNVQHADFPFVRATPDGLAPGQFTCEAKCPKFAVWADTRERWSIGKRGLDCVPSSYRWQSRWQCWASGLRSGRFVVYHPAGGGICIPYEITQEDCDAMAARVVVVEGLIANWIDILRG